MDNTSTERLDKKPAKCPKTASGANIFDDQQASSTNKSQVFALVDCNNFFVSCERLFRPYLKTVPVAVLSNNDGCIIARSNEVKALGIKMGEPFFKHEWLLNSYKAKVFSANFPFYGDIAQRVSNMFDKYSPKIEIYSIDEAFLRIDNLSITDYSLWAKQLAFDVEKAVGIPVSVGVGATKTLAKLATEKAKKDPQLKGGFSLIKGKGMSNKQYQTVFKEALNELPLEDIWGIGRKRAYLLHRMGLKSALEVANLTDEWVLKNMTITGLRTIRELRGESCIPLDEFETNNQQKNLSVTRSFGQKLRSLAELESAMASFAMRAATRLRRKEQLAWRGSVFVRARLPDRTTQYLRNDFDMAVPTSFTSDIIKAANKALFAIYEPNYRYEKAGITLSSLVDETEQQMSILGNHNQAEQMISQISLMKAIDDLSLRYGKQAVTFAAYDSTKWQSKQKRVGPAFTTRWDQLPIVKLR